MEGILFLLSAPSGAGKTTVCRRLLSANRDLTRIVTCTTRPPREGETNGEDYHFMSREEFADKAEADAFLESAEVHGHRYGTLKSGVLQKVEDGQDALLNIDVQGAALLRRRAESEFWLRQCLVTVFLTPSSFAELERRLRKRGSEAEADVHKRLAAAKRELEASEAFNYLVISESMEEDLRRMQIILEAEKMRRRRMRLPGSFFRLGGRGGERE